MSSQQHPTDKVVGTVAEAAKVLGSGLNQTYEAARRGEIPTVRIGRKILVKWVPFIRMLKGETPAA